MSLSFVCVLTWSLLGVKKAWATPRSVSFRGFIIQTFQRESSPLFICGVLPPPPRTGRNVYCCSVEVMCETRTETLATQAT